MVMAMPVFVPLTSEEVSSESTFFSTMRAVLVDREVRQQRQVLDAESDSRSHVKSSIPDPVREAFTEGLPRTALQASHQVTLGTSLYADVAMYPDLFHVLDRTSTLGGRACLKAILDAPIADISILRKRSTVLSDLSEVLQDPAQSPHIRSALATLQSTEADVAWMLHHPRHDEELKELYELAFFKIWPLRWMNRSAVALTALNIHRIVVSPLLGLLSPLIYFVIPYLVLRYRVGLKVSLVQYIRLMRASMSVASAVSPPSVQWAKYASLGFSLLFYFQGLFSSIELSATVSAVCSALCRRTKQVQDFKASAAVLIHACHVLGTSVQESFFPDTLDLTRSINEPFCDPTTASGEWTRPMLLHNFGERLKAFKGMDHEDCVSRMQHVYALDALISVVDAKNDLGACDVEFVTASRPVFDADGLKHPCISRERAVPNTVILCAHDTHSPHTVTKHVRASACACAALLTGPNAGGKSTLLKSVLLATIMAQTLTIAPCVSMRLTPYSHIHSHINVPDVQGSKSLFEAEMDRAKESMDVLAGMGERHPDRFSLVIMDEVFSSTNPVEGIAGAYSVAKNLAESPAVTLVVSTHFLYLRKLALLKREHGSPVFQLLQMPVEVDAATTCGFTYPYRLSGGVCEQLIALELLRASGFSEAVMRDALAVKQSLLLPPAKAAGTRRRPGRKQTRSAPRPLQ